MFSFLKSRHTADVGKHIRRICDRTTPNLPVPYELRTERRYNRTIPMLICPCSKKGKAECDQALIVVSGNLSEHSIGLVTHDPFHFVHGILGIWMGNKIMDEPWFFKIQVRCNRPLGAGFWTVGVSLEDMLDRDEKDKLGVLNEVVYKLMPDPNEEPVGN